MRVAILCVGAMATAMALTVKSVYGLWYLSSDLVYVILFPQLVSVVYMRRHCNTYGSLGAYVIGLLLRGLGGEDIVGLPPVIKYPFYNEVDGQLFPFRTMAMLVSLFSIVSISTLIRWAFVSGRISARFDMFHCFVGIPNDASKVQEPLEDNTVVLDAHSCVTDMSGRDNPALVSQPEQDDVKDQKRQEHHKAVLSAHELVTDVRGRVNPVSNWQSAEDARVFSGSYRNRRGSTGWDAFETTPKPEADDTDGLKCVDVVLKIVKVVAYLVTFVLVLASAVVSKGTLLVITSNVGQKTMRVYPKERGVSYSKEYETITTNDESLAWRGVLFLIMIVPELLTLWRSSSRCIFSNYHTPDKITFFTVFAMETLQTIGVSLLVFVVLPDLDVLKGGMLANCVCFVPAFLGMLSHHKDEDRRILRIIMDVLSLVAQVTSFFFWPWVVGGPRAWAIPVAVFFASFRWWPNYVDRRSPLTFIARLGEMKDNLRDSRYFTYIFISLWKILLIFGCMLGFTMLIVDDVSTAFCNFVGVLRRRGIEFILLPKKHQDDLTISMSQWTPLRVAAIQVISSLLCYASAKFACKIRIQRFSFAFPIFLSVPVTLFLFYAACEFQTGSVCFLDNYLPKYLYWRCPEDSFLQFIKVQHGWLWFAWFLSQTWIAAHVWMPKRFLKRKPSACFAYYERQRLIFISYGGHFLSIGKSTVTVASADVTVLQNAQEITRRAIRVFPSSRMKPSSKVTSCMSQYSLTKKANRLFRFLLRMDDDQCARRNAREYLKRVDPDYYEFEAHVIFDDAFEESDDNGEEMVVNRFVKQLVELVDLAASDVHQYERHLRPPKKIATPYGGRLVWRMPGKNKLVVHLKDRSKIRNRKRWSQVMYMYYLLGHKLMESPIDVERKKLMSENTFILALDGDINFRPHAVRLLVDFMKKNKNLGAACGRTHPVGSGPMVWFQKFEYAMGHWLQKATEHMIGCVLCSPGCFSLFRAKALMDDNVIGKYKTRSDVARHIVQCDQGEDRWLCTLLLQRGYRVAYCAASDAYTHCPEGYGEFFTQRRRWAPSTLANLLDLLENYKHIVAINDNISFVYIVYQAMLMIGNILGPGTIFLIMVTVAQVMGACYALLVMVALGATIIQIAEDGVGSPSAIFLISLSGSFFVAALMHPREFVCVFPGVLYFLGVPSVYLFLFVYSIVNLNVASWGTRETQTKSKTELEKERVERDELSTGKSQRGHRGFPDLGRGEDRNVTHRREIHLSTISGQLDQINRRMSCMETQLESVLQSGTSEQSARGSSFPNERVNEGSSGSNFDTCSTLNEYTEHHQQREDLRNPYWIKDKDLGRGFVVYLSSSEKRFWEDLIKKYLSPIDENADDQARIAHSLKELRNRVVFVFFMLNALFVLLVFAIQVSRAHVCVPWPLEVKTKITLINDQIIITTKSLRLEPIGLIIAAFFAFVMVIQFVGMICHRFHTFSHILASVELSCCKQKVGDPKDNSFIGQDVIHVAKRKQGLDGIDGDDASTTESDDSGRPEDRKTTRRLERRRKQGAKMGTLDVAFEKRCKSYSADGLGGQFKHF
ncbi:chitin synthase, putative [Ixodes scapularis]|uniref:chitin synthase n=1 Tax=Ixodes scapularis TaxID=6945 RepID=B7PII1_IXOSC|nr:chitin synthase, putative [Ixodes scapularis]|eukprot:XP_002405234.1 chitin synthase, putative [Ixodes scapularis]